MGSLGRVASGDLQHPDYQTELSLILRYQCCDEKNRFKKTEKKSRMINTSRVNWNIFVDSTHLCLVTLYSVSCNTMLRLVNCNRLVNLGISKQQHLYFSTKNLI